MTEDPKRDPKKLCPMTFNTPENVYPEEGWHCSENCAWFIDGHCAIHNIAGSLDALAFHLQGIANR
jgi:hypothetical protein